MREMHSSRSRFGGAFRQIACLIAVIAAQAASAEDPPPATAAPAPVATRIEKAVADGFEGAVLVVRDGQEVALRTSGFANRETRTSITPDTIFAIGSTPIDFTKVAVLKLIAAEKLRLSDTLGQRLPGVPEDKAGITVEHLLTGRSGLVDFIDLPSDRDPDHAFIDRGEALRRTFAAPLLFEPGKGNEHSHAAFGVLAAIVEVVSGTSYAEHLRSEVLGPAGMKDTGFFGEAVSPERLAIGYGIKSDGAVNAPPYWGKTSWLVMGSGGMTSTLRDMQRWFVALRRPAFVDQTLARRFLPVGSLLSGGDMYGFEILTAESERGLMIVMSNAIASRERRRAFNAFGEDLARMVLEAPGGAAPRFSLGIELEVGTGPEPRIAGLVPGGAAAASGLAVGDVIISVNGEALGDEPRRVLARLLETGAPLEFRVRRDGSERAVTVTPKPREGA